MYSSQIVTTSNASFLTSSNKLDASWTVKSLNDVNDCPPFPISLLNNLIPITKLDNSHNYVTFSFEFSDINGPNAALGITLSSAAATSLSTLIK